VLSVYQTRHAIQIDLLPFTLPHYRCSVWHGSNVVCAGVCSLDPVLVNVPLSTDVKMSCVSCALNTDCLLVGDSQGQVAVFQLRATTVLPAHCFQVSSTNVIGSLGHGLQHPSCSA